MEQENGQNLCFSCFQSTAVYKVYNGYLCWFYFSKWVLITRKLIFFQIQNAKIKPTSQENAPQEPVFWQRKQIFCNVLLLHFSKAMVQFWFEVLHIHSDLQDTPTNANEDAGKLPYLSPNILLEGSLRNREQTPKRVRFAFW